MHSAKIFFFNQKGRLLPICQWHYRKSRTWAHDDRYNLLLPMNQRVLNKSSKKHNKTGWKSGHGLLLVRHVPNCMSYYEAIDKLVETVRAHC